jgi:ElaA protein
MGLQWHIKSFESLSVHELYDILRLRSEIFVVEQNCVYLDLDGKDKLALHLFGIYEGKIVAYSRLFKKWGQELMQEAIARIKTHFNESKITIGAQLYLKKFYENQGFVQTSEMYLEDDIPHIEMLKG